MKKNIAIGNAPCSWGTLEFGEMGGARFGYTNMLDELVEAGYTGSELGDWGFMPTIPHDLADAFRARNLTLTGAFVPVDLRDPNAHEAGTANAIRTATLLAQTADQLQSAVRPFVVLADDNCKVEVRTKEAGRITPEMGLSEREWRIFADGCNHVARAIHRATGLRTVFHHHCGGWVETPAEIARLLSLTDEQSIGLVFDTGHFVFGAGTADGLMDALDAYANRIWYVHFKDCDLKVAAQVKANQWDYFVAVQHGIFCELGKGVVDFSAVKKWLVAQNYAGFITVEQDIIPGMGAPKESAQRNREFLHSIGL